MKNKIKVASVTTGILMASAFAASAAVIDFDTSSAVVSGGTVMEFPNAAPLVREFTFTGNAPFFAYMDLTVERQFSLMLEDYQPSFSGAAQSFFSIQNLDTSGYLTTSGNCSTAGVISVLDDVSCDSVNGAEGIAGNPPPITFSSLDAGSYRVAFFENGNPTSVQADFRVSAVPLPAAGWLMIAGLGGLAAMRRRRKNSV